MRAVVGRSAAVLLCVAGVPVMVVTLVHVLFGVPLSAYRPVINDEVAYWHQALTFSRVGFGGGYYTLNEATNPSGLTAFGPHGPGFAVLYGSVGWLFGWHRYSVPILHLTALAIAGGVWASCSRVSLQRLWLSGLLLVTFWHTMFWAPTGMQEPLHHAGAMGMAGLFAHVLGPLPRWWVRPAGWILLGVLSFIRPSWVLLLPLWALATSYRARARVIVGSFIASMLVAVAVLLAYSSTSAPYGTGFFFLRALSFSVGVQSLMDNVMSNVRRLQMLDQFEPIEFLLRYQYWTFLLTLVVTSLATVWRTRAWRTVAAMPLLVAAIAMTAALAGMLLFYEFASFAEHRVLSAFLLFGALLALAAPGRTATTLVTALVVWNIVYARSSIDNLEAGRRDHFGWDERGVHELEAAVKGTVAYQPGVDRWCNTLLTNQYPPALIAIPAGIGLSVYSSTDNPLRPRSQYLLLDSDAVAQVGADRRLDLLATLPYAGLYRNLDADCGQPPPSQGRQER